MSKGCKVSHLSAYWKRVSSRALGLRRRRVSSKISSLPLPLALPWPATSSEVVPLAAAGLNQLWAREASQLSELQNAVLTCQGHYHPPALESGTCACFWPAELKRETGTGLAASAEQQRKKSRRSSTTARSEQHNVCHITSHIFCHFPKMLHLTNFKQLVKNNHFLPLPVRVYAHSSMYQASDCDCTSLL